MKILVRFKRLNLPELKLKEKYTEALSLYMKDLERVQDMYNQNRYTLLNSTYTPIIVNTYCIEDMIQYDIVIYLSTDTNLHSLEICHPSVERLNGADNSTNGLLSQ